MSELVSVYMITYNHAPWIEKAIRSIMSQITDFEYKLYVHDDASTDGTTEIVKRLSEEFPDKIMAFFEEENQYSKGVKITRTIISPHFKGKYIASCEGDDYWVDQYKLQKQVDYMESHPDCTLCFSNAIIVDTENRKIKKFFSVRSWNDKNINKKLKSKTGADFSIEEVILLDFTPTASNLYRREAYDEICRFKNGLDLLTRLVTTSMGYAHYHSEVFTAYRTGNSASASGSIMRSFDKLKISYLDKHTDILNEFDEYTDYKYTEIIQHEIKRKEIELYYNAGKEYYKKIKKHELYRELTAIKKIKIFSIQHLGSIVKIYKRMRYKNNTLRKM